MELVPQEDPRFADITQNVNALSDGLHELPSLNGFAEDVERIERVSQYDLQLAASQGYLTCISTIGGYRNTEDPAGHRSNPFFRLSVSELEDDLFDAIWAKGVPVLVDHMLPRFGLDWSPQGFIRRAGEDVCSE